MKNISISKTENLKIEYPLTSNLITKDVNLMIQPKQISKDNKNINLINNNIKQISKENSKSKKKNTLKNLLNSPLTNKEKKYDNDKSKNSKKVSKGKTKEIIANKNDPYKNQNLNINSNIIHLNYEDNINNCFISPNDNLIINISDQNDNNNINEERRQYTFGKEEDLCLQYNNILSNNENNENIKDNITNTLEDSLECDKNEENLNNNNLDNYTDEIFRKIIIDKRKSFRESLKNTKNNDFLNNEIKNDCDKNFNTLSIIDDTNNNEDDSLNTKIIKKNENNINSIRNKEKSNRNQNNSFNNNSHRISNNTAATNSIFSTNSNSNKTKEKKNTMNEENEKIKNISDFQLNSPTVDMQSSIKNDVSGSFIKCNNFNQITDIKYWLNNIGLSKYYANFIKNSILYITTLVERIKSFNIKEKYEMINRILNIKKPGHIYRILVKLEIDFGLLNKKIIDFLNKDLSKEIGEDGSLLPTSKDFTELETSREYKFNSCCGKNLCFSEKENDLKYFLKRYDLSDYTQNFLSNGFDNIEYILLQMYSSFPFNEEIFENYLYIYEEDIKIKILNALYSEMKKINNFLSSEEYKNNSNKKDIKYSTVFIDDINDSQSLVSKIHITNNEKYNKLCTIF